MKIEGSVRGWAAAMIFGATALSASTERPLRSPTLNFSPPTSASPDVVFVVGGDNRPTGKGAPMPRVTRTIFSEIAIVRPAFSIWTGDTVYGYGDTPAELSAEYSAFLALAAPAGVALFNAPGNHEIHHREGEPCGDRSAEREFEKRFGNLYGSFDYSDLHFIALDTASLCAEDSIEGAQLAWLKNDLDANKGARAIFVFSHTEFFSSPTIDPDAVRDHGAVKNGAALRELFRKYPVKAVFSGHEHLYWRESRDGIEYFVLGGSGAPLYAAPERGGFSHYLVVRIRGGDIRYDTVEPGRFFVEPGKARPGEQDFWLVNSNDADLPADGVELQLAPGLGPCAALSAEARIPRSDGSATQVELAGAGCAVKNGRRQFRLRLLAPRRSSVLITVRKKK